MSDPEAQRTVIRLARTGDLEDLREVERAAGVAFRELGMAWVADDDPPTVAELAAFASDGRAWVYEDAAGRPAGYLLLDVVDGEAHIEQVSVHPEYAHRRIGQALIEVAADWARQRGMSAMTLTTFADVPWNGPYYRRLGFHDVPHHQQGAGLLDVRRREVANGLDQWPRIAMRRELD